MDIRFSPVTSADLPMLADWLSKLHVRQWWGEPAHELSMIHDMVDGRDVTKPFIFSVDGTMCGYIQSWRAADNQTPEILADAPWVGEVPTDAAGIDMFIGDPTRLGTGIGPAVLKSFIAKLANEGARHFIIDPDPKNKRAVRAYEKAGFQPVAHLLGKTGDSLIMEIRLSMLPAEKDT